MRVLSRIELQAFLAVSCYLPTYLPTYLHTFLEMGLKFQYC